MKDHGAAMAFQHRMTDCARLVETWLGEELDRPAGQPERLTAAMRHACLGGGKRFRPFLVIETAALFGLAPAAVRTAAVAIEMMHCYSLVHDDLPAMDNDRLRRGLPTVWAAFDEWTAILAGDALAALAFEVAARPDTHPAPGVRLALISGLARSCGPAGMVGGQCLDLEADKLGRPASPDIAHVERLQSMKTGALIAFSAEAGAILAEAAPEQRRALAAYGTALGMAFQISDDLLDAEGSADKVGKAVAKDAGAGKATWVSLLGIAETRARLAEVERRAIDSLALFGDRASTLVEAARFVSRRDH
jgi:farnesyl diphosphate synthase